MTAELWDIWSKSTAAKVDQKDSIDMQTLLEHSCFLGAAHVPLSETLPAAALQDTAAYNGPLLPGNRYRVVRECVLSRRHGGDRVAGGSHEPACSSGRDTLSECMNMPVHCC